MTDDPVTCTRCGEPHERCRAHNRAGKPCRLWPKAGQRVCGLHGGEAPQALAAAQVRLEQRRAVLAVETFGLPREVDPHAALLEELHRTAGAVEWLSAVVADIKRREVTWGQVRTKTGGEDHGTTHEAGTNAWVLEWRTERKHLLAVSKACIDVGIEERRVRLAEDAGRQLAAVIRAVLDRIGLTDAQRIAAGEAVPEEIRRVMELGPVRRLTETEDDEPTTRGAAL